MNNQTSIGGYQTEACCKELTALGWAVETDIAYVPNDRISCTMTFTKDSFEKVLIPKLLKAYRVLDQHFPLHWDYKVMDVDGVFYFDVILRKKVFT